MGQSGLSELSGQTARSLRGQKKRNGRLQCSFAHQVFEVWREGHGKGGSRGNWNKSCRNKDPTCGGLHENGPCRLMCLHSWFLISGLVWEGWIV